MTLIQQAASIEGADNVHHRPCEMQGLVRQLTRSVRGTTTRCSRRPTTQSLQVKTEYANLSAWGAGKCLGHSSMLGRPKFGVLIGEFAGGPERWRRDHQGNMPRVHGFRIGRVHLGRLLRLRRVQRALPGLRPGEIQGRAGGRGDGLLPSEGCRRPRARSLGPRSSPTARSGSTPATWGRAHRAGPVRGARRVAPGSPADPSPRHGSHRSARPPRGRGSPS